MTEASQITSAAANLSILGDGLTFDPVSQSLILPADPERTKVEAIFSIPAQDGAPRRDFLVSVTELPVDRNVVTVFDSADALAQVTYLGYVAPSWTLQDGFARLVLEGGSRAHGDWSGAGGDGLYRCLVRWSGADLPYSVDRRFSFGARVDRVGTTWTGVRIDAYATSFGVKKLQLRAYTGVQGATVVLATADATWEYDAWHWLEVELAGGAVKARIFPEAAAAPDWQVSGTTTQTSPGAYGPGGFPALDRSPVIDVRTLEHRPALS